MQALEHARKLNQDEQPQAALKQLKPLYARHPDNLEIILEIVTAFEQLEMWEKARTMLIKAIKLRPHLPALWLHLAHIYRWEDKPAAALKVIDKAYRYDAGNLPLELLRAQLLAELHQIGKMHEQLDLLILQYPEQEAEILFERAEIYDQLSQTPAEDEAIISDSFGMAYAIEPLNRALNDLGAALRLSPNALNIRLARAHLHKRLQNFDLAAEDFSAALESLTSEQEPLRDNLERERDNCLSGGQHERESLAKSLRQHAKTSENHNETRVEAHWEKNLIEAMANQYEKGADLFSLLEEIHGDPEKTVALSIAQDIIKHGDEPEHRYTPVATEAMPKSARAFCRRAEKRLHAAGYTTLGDYEPVGLSEHLGQRAILRLFVSPDKKTCAAAYELTPLKPSFPVWLLMLVTGKWKKVRALELESESRDGEFLVTNNSQNLNPFTAASPKVITTSLSPAASLDDIIRIHQTMLESRGTEQFQTTENAEAVFARQDRLRLVKNHYRQQINMVTDTELQQLLGKQHDKMAPLIREYITRLGNNQASSETRHC